MCLLLLYTWAGFCGEFFSLLYGRLTENAEVVRVWDLAFFPVMPLLLYFDTQLHGKKSASFPGWSVFLQPPCEHIFNSAHESEWAF